MKRRFPIKIEDAFSQDNLLEAYTFVEGQMSFYQGKIGIIPEKAGNLIHKKASIENLDRVKLRKAYKKNNNLILSITNELASICGKEGKYVHWGGTTKNITDTGQLLILKELHKDLLLNLTHIINSLKKLASQHTSTLMIGRTMGQYALPITFGFKIAGWLQSLMRCEERFRSAEKIVFTLHFGGAVGGHHGFKNSGMLLSEKLSTSFSLRNSAIPNRTSVDKYADYVIATSFLASTFKQISREIYLLMSQDIAELSEIQSKDFIGSSTMPQKTNPMLTAPILADCNILISQANSVLTSEFPINEGDDQYNLLVDKVLKSTVVSIMDLSIRFNTLINSIIVNKKRMESNLMAEKDSILLENLMLNIGESLGRAEAHRHLSNLNKTAKQKNISIQTLLTGDKLIKKHIKNDNILDLLNPKNYLGECVLMTKNIVKKSGLKILEIKKRIKSDNLKIS